MALNNLLSRKETVQLPDGGVNRGGSIDLFEPNTAVRITTYKDSDLTQPNTNPVILDAAGKASIWFAVDADWDFYPAPSAAVPVPLAYVSEQNINPDSLGAGSASGLVPNGSFEIDTDANDEPDGWTLTDEAGSTNFLDTGNSTDGLQSMRFESTGSGGGNIVTDDFFTVNETDDLSVDFDIFSSVVDVRNIVRVEWYDVSQVTISNTDVYDNASTNPLTFTRQQTAASPPAGARFAKLRIIGCDPSDATPGATNYDRVNVFYPLIVSNTFSNLLVTDAIEPDLLDTGNTMNLGAADPAANPHMAFGPSIIQAKADATNAATLDINPLGGIVDAGAQSGTGGFRAWRDGILALDVNNGAELRYRGIGTANPSTGGTQQARLALQNESGQEIAEFGHGGFVAGTELLMVNRVQSAAVRIQGTTAALAVASGLIFTPESGVQLNFNDIDALTTLVTGARLTGTTAPNTILDFNEFGDSLKVRHQWNGGQYLIDLFQDSAEMRFNGRNSGSAARRFINMDPDAAVTLHHPLSATGATDGDVARTISNATGGLEINNQLTASGYERALTVSDLTSVNEWDFIQEGIASTSVANSTAIVNVVVIDNTIFFDGLSSTEKIICTWEFEGLIVGGAGGLRFRWRNLNAAHLNPTNNLGLFRLYDEETGLVAVPIAGDMAAGNVVTTTGTRTGFVTGGLDGSLLIGKGQFEINSNSQASDEFQFGIAQDISNAAATVLHRGWTFRMKFSEIVDP